jgi:hypothetical protein
MTCPRGCGLEQSSPAQRLFATEPFKRLDAACQSRQRLHMPVVWFVSVDFSLAGEQVKRREFQIASCGRGRQATESGGHPHQPSGTTSALLLIDVIMASLDWASTVEDDIRWSSCPGNTP